MLVAAALVGAADWLFPIRGLLSIALCAALSLLAIPWTVHVFASLGDREKTPQESTVGWLLFRLGMLFLLLAFLTAKWLVVVYSHGDHADFAASSQSYTLGVLFVFSLGLAARGLHIARFAELVADHPARLMALSFGITGVAGALVLSLPFSVETVKGVSLVNNLFMAFSAVCVTGLAVNNVAATYSVAGQAVLCLLIQVGGLGIMVLSAAISVLSGRRMKVKSSAVLAEMVDVSSLASLRRTVVMILFYTLFLEGAGATLLYLDFAARPEMAHRFGGDLAGAGDARWAAVFHAVSAFCNAGFSNLSGGLMPFSSSPSVTLTISVLVVLGGIGFPVIDELFHSLFTFLRRRRVTVLSLNTRVALRSTALLLVAMAGVYLLLEWRSSMSGLGFGERLNAALFQSVSCRTAGFNLVNVGAMTPAVLVLTAGAMFVGACPGSTAGGIKTTTLAVLVAGVRSELVGRPPCLLNRRVPEAMIRRASSVAVLSMLLVSFVFVLLLLVERHAPLALAFEAVSAFSTTGLSTGITPELSTTGKLIVTLTMFIGRIGPLTLALALARAASERSIQLPEERVMIG